MRDPLPNIAIRADVPALDFLNRMASIAKQHTAFRVDGPKPVDGAAHMTMVNLVPTKAMLHEGLVGLLIADTHTPDHVRIEVIASRWNP